MLTLLLAALVLEVPPVGAQGWRCGGHTIEWVGGAPAATIADGAVDSADRGYGPLHEDGSRPTIPEPPRMTRQLWDSLVFDTHDRPWPRAPHLRPVVLRQTQVIGSAAVRGMKICVQGPEHSDFGKRVQPYANAAWWRRQIERWTGVSWQGEFRIAECSSRPPDGWIYVREAPFSLPPNVLAVAGSRRRQQAHAGGAWLASDLNWRPGLEDVGEDYFESSLAHELGHALGFYHVPRWSGYVMVSGSASAYPAEESSMAQLAYRVGPNVRYPGLVRDVEPGDTAEGNPDRQVLNALYNETDGQNWRKSANWGSTRPLDHWHGVATGAGDRVNWLELHRNNLSGTIPRELGSLSALLHLDLESNNLSGPIPAGLGGLTDLQILDLGQNALSGPIPPELGRMQSLTRLWLSRNDLHGRIPAELGGLPDLYTLDLRGNDLTGPLPPELGDLSGLRDLWLEHNQLSGTVPPELGRMPLLRGLYLGYNRLSGPLPASFTELDRLLGLNIVGNDGLCAPADDEFQAWLATLNYFAGPTCEAESVPVLPVAALVLAALVLGGLGVGLLRPRNPLAG